MVRVAISGALRPSLEPRPLGLAVLLALAALGAGCGGATTPSSNPGDAAVGQDVAVTQDVAQDVAAAQDVAVAQDVASADASSADAGGLARGHHSYVPADLRPTAAARLLVMGDSISAGYGASPRATAAYYGLLSRNNDTAWPSDMAASLQAHFGSAVPVVNVAVAGATTATMRSGQLQSLRSMGPMMGHTVVVITIGGNDITTSIVTGSPTGAPLDTAVANLRATVEFLQDRANFPDGVSVYVAAVYDPSDGVGYVQGCFFDLRLPAFVSALDVWRTRYVALGTEMHFAVVDALGHFHGHGHNHDDPDNPYWSDASHDGWFSDCLHPNNRGHSEMRKLFYEAVDPSYTLR